MDLNKLELTSFTLSEWYRHSLVIPDSKKPSEAAAAPKQGAKWLGNNRKHILLAVNNSDTVHLPDKDLEFLTSILSACRLSLEDVTILNIQNFPGAGYKELTGQFGSTQVLLFGMEPAELGLPMNFPPFQNQAFNKVHYLHAPSLARLAENRQLKSELWAALKKIFNIG